MESVWKGNGKGIEKLISSKIGETGMELEWKQNKTFMNEFGDVKNWIEIKK